MVRIIVFILLIIGYLIIIQQNTSDKILIKRYITFASILLILQSGLRHIAIGSDTYQYYLLYEMAKTYSIPELFQYVIHPDSSFHRDPFYFLVSGVFDSIFHSFRLFLFFVAIVFFSALGHFLYRFLKTPKQALISYLFYLGMFYGYYSITMIRQTFAVAIVFEAFVFLLDRKFIKYLGLTLLSALFHSSALIFLFAPVVIYGFSLKKLSFFSLLALPFFFLYRFQLASFFVTEDNTYYDYLSASIGDSVGSIPIGVLYVLFFLGAVFYSDYLEKNGLGYFAKLYTVAICFLPLLWIDNSAFRISFYFSLSMFVLLPYLVERLPFHTSVSAKYALTICVLFSLMLFSIRPNDYYFYWQKSNNIERPMLDPEIHK